MDWRSPTEQAALGFLGYGGLSFLLSHSYAVLFFSALLGITLNGGYAILRPLPWRRWMLKVSDRACVSVTPDLRLIEVSRKAPDRLGFIRFSELDKETLFKRLEKFGPRPRLNPATIPFHMRVILEERRELQTPWAMIEPHLVKG